MNVRALDRTCLPRRLLARAVAVEPRYTILSGWCPAISFPTLGVTP